MIGVVRFSNSQQPFLLAKLLPPVKVGRRLSIKETKEIAIGKAVKKSGRYQGIEQSIVNSLQPASRTLGLKTDFRREVKAKDYEHA